MPRFVVLRHVTPPGHDRPTHGDFMLECGGALRTWALAEPPSPGRTIAAEELPDHRLAYLDYEGEVSGGRGSVTRWDAGTYEVLGGRLAPGDEVPLAERAGHLDEVHVLMHGEKLAGEVVLTLTPVRSPPDQGAYAPRSPGSGAVRSAASSPRYWSFIWKGT
jgi:hypothetical protein